MDINLNIFNIVYVIIQWIIIVDIGELSALKIIVFT